MASERKWFHDFFDATYAKVLGGQFDEAASGAEAGRVRRLLGLRPGCRVLDIPCGYGRLTIPLAAWGLKMTGVDLVAGYLARGRREARRRGLDIRFLCRDMRPIDFDGEFDAAFNWFGSMGYFPDEENLDFCRAVWRALRPGGRFLVETINKTWLLANFRRRMVRTYGGVRITHISRWVRRASRVDGEWTFHLPSGPHVRRVSIRAYDGADMRAMLRAAGFTDIRLYGWPPLGRFTRHSRRLLAVARRTSPRARRRRGP